MKKYLPLILFCLIVNITLYSQDRITSKSDWEMEIRNVSLSKSWLYKSQYIEIEYKNISSSEKILLLPIKRPGFQCKLEDLENTFSTLSIQLAKDGKEITTYIYSDLNEKNKIDKTEKLSVPAGKSIVKNTI